MKRWKRTIISSVVFGVIAFFAVGFMVDFYILPHIEKKIQKVGYSGTYTFQTIPKDILNEASYGLTKVTKDGTIQQRLSEKDWLDSLRRHGITGRPRLEEPTGFD